MSSVSLAVLLALAAVGAMAAAWRIAERTGKSGWADVIWSFIIGALGVPAALIPIGAPEAPTIRQWTVAAVALIWSVRLGLHILFRTLHGREDPRYAALRAEWGDSAPGRLFWFLQIQAAVALLLVLCVGVAARNPAPEFRLVDWVGFAVILAAIAGEGVADAQLRRFGAKHPDRAAICDQGLWGLSRHPNYFFQWLGWVGYAIIAIDPFGGYPLGWLALAGPIAMYALLVHVSGIPPLEAHMLRSRGKPFAAYQRRVSAFFPLPRQFGSGTAPP